LEHLDQRWGTKYPMAVRSWQNNWAEVSTFFDYPSEIRRIIYTTNSVENYHRQLRKVTKTKAAFPTPEAAFILYLKINQHPGITNIEQKHQGSCYQGRY